MSSASVNSIWSCIWRDEFVLAHSDMVEGLGIAVGKSLQVVAVEHALGDQLGEYHEQAVGVGDGPRDERLVDHRQLVVAVGFLVGRNHRLDHAANYAPRNPKLLRP